MSSNRIHPKSFASWASRQGYARLLRYAWPYRSAWLAVVATTFLGLAVSLLQPWPLMVLVDHVLGDAPMSPRLAAVSAFLPGAHSRAGLLAWVALATVAFWLMQAMVETVAAYLCTRASYGMTQDLGQVLLARIQRRSLSFHRLHGVGDSMTRIMTDSWSASGLANKLVIGPIPAVFTMAAMVLIMHMMDPGLTMIALAASPLMAGAAVLFGRRAREVARARSEVESRIQAHVHQTLTGIHTVQAFGQESREHEQFRGFADAVIKAQKRTMLLENLSGLWTGLFATLATGVVLLVGGRHVLRGSLSLGALLLFVSYLQLLQSQMNLLASSYTSLQSLRGQIDRVLEILDAEPELRVAPKPVPLTSPRGEVRITNVTFGYVPDRPVLSNVSAVASPGQTIAIVGPSGAGKSTLVSLIPRFFDPWSGQVTIDGVDVRNLGLRQLRQHIGIVLQDSHLFGVSVAENIGYGRPNATRDQIRAAACAANADGFITRLPQGYDTVLGERGCTLSGGERQRISIARAFLKNAPVLILDEPTSAVDAQAESLLVQALQRLMHGRTTFIIAHRLSTVRHAERVIVLEAGRVVETGAHDQLILNGGLYAGLSRAAEDPLRLFVRTEGEVEPSQARVDGGGG